LLAQQAKAALRRLQPLVRAAVRQARGFVEGDLGIEDAQKASASPAAIASSESVSSLRLASAVASKAGKSR
jgi:hypothetical protein